MKCVSLTVCIWRLNNNLQIDLWVHHRIHSENIYRQPCLVWFTNAILHHNDDCQNHFAFGNNCGFALLLWLILSGSQAYFHQRSIHAPCSVCLLFLVVDICCTLDE